MTEQIRVQVVVDTDELRQWADKHADAGQAGVAHALYEAASRYEQQAGDPPTGPDVLHDCVVRSTVLGSGYLNHASIASLDLHLADWERAYEHLGRRLEVLRAVRANRVVNRA